MADQLITGTTLIEDKRSEKGEIWSCSGCDFTSYKPELDDKGMSTGDDGSVIAQADTITLMNGVHLPNGATITGVIVYGNAGATAETWTLYRANFIGTPSAMATANIGTEDITISNSIVNNDSYHYFLQTSSLDTNDVIWGARIKYEF